MSTFSLYIFDAAELFCVFSNVCLADASSLAGTRNVGLIVAVFILAFAIWQIRIQFARVRLSQKDLPILNEQGYKFFKRRSKRRLQLACLALVVGTSILVGSSVAPNRFPRLWTCAWLCVLFFGIWICALGVADAISTWLSFEVERSKNHADQVLLKYKIEKFKQDSLKEQNQTYDSKTP